MVVICICCEDLTIFLFDTTIAYITIDHRVKVNRYENKIIKVKYTHKCEVVTCGYYERLI